MRRLWGAAAGTPPWRGAPRQVRAPAAYNSAASKVHVLRLSGGPGSPLVPVADWITKAAPPIRQDPQEEEEEEEREPTFSGGEGTQRNFLFF